MHWRGKGKNAKHFSCSRLWKGQPHAFVLCPYSALKGRYSISENILGIDHIGLHCDDLRHFIDRILNIAGRTTLKWGLGGTAVSVNWFDHVKECGGSHTIKARHEAEVANKSGGLCPCLFTVNKPFWLITMRNRLPIITQQLCRMTMLDHRSCQGKY